MSRGDPTHIDTTAVFVQSRLRGTLMLGNMMDVMGMPERMRSRLRGMSMPNSDSMNPWERMRSWRRMPIRVHNARLLDPPATLDSHGFELVRIESAVSGRQSIDEQRETYCIESRRIIEALTGCKESRTLNQVHRGGFHGRRPGDPLDRTAPRAGAVAVYVQQVHTDMSPWVELLPEWSAFVRGRHGAILNVWRSTDLAGPVEHMPLAVCHARHVAPCDMVATWAPGLLQDGNGFVSYHLVHNASQHWFYYPRMAPDEAMVLRLYDTREAMGCRRGVFHVAVDDPGAPSGGKRRESLDIRVAAVFENETEPDARRARFLAELPPIPDSLRHSVGARGGKPSRAE